MGDFSGDGRLDIALGSEGNGDVVVLFNLCGQPSTDLGVTVVDSPDPVDEGELVTYSATVTNHGSREATNVVLTQTLNFAEFVSMTASTGVCTVGGELNNYCALGTLPAGGIATVEVVVRTIAAAPSALMTSVFGVTSDLADDVPANNAVAVTTTVNAVSRVFTVNTTADTFVPGSLRYAITYSDADAGDRDRIVFAIPGAGPHTITLTSPLLPIVQPIEIDATTQPGYAGAPLIELNGNGFSGLRLTGGNSLVRGLAINRFNGPGITIQTAGGNVIEGNYIGTDATGTVARPNTSHGILVQSANNRIGGTVPGAGNIVSGNLGSGVVVQGPGATNNLVQGNAIGTSPSRDLRLGNLGDGVLVDGPGNTVGAGNTIVANGTVTTVRHGIHITQNGPRL